MRPAMLVEWAVGCLQPQLCPHVAPALAAALPFDRPIRDVAVRHGCVLARDMRHAGQFSLRRFDRRHAALIACWLHRDVWGKDRGQAGDVTGSRWV